MKYKTPYVPATNRAPESGTYRPDGRRSPELARAVQAVYDDVHNKISDSDREFLENDAILWLRALRLVSANIANAIQMRSAELDAIRPGIGEAPSKEYLNGLKLFARRRQSYLHNLAIIRVRREEILYGLGMEHIGQTPNLGEVIGWFENVIIKLNEKDYDGAVLLAERSMRNLIDVDDSGCTILDDFDEALDLLDSVISQEGYEGRNGDSEHDRIVHLLDKYDDEDGDL
jgi:hypothetical protein